MRRSPGGHVDRKPAAADAYDDQEAVVVAERGEGLVPFAVRLDSEPISQRLDGGRHVVDGQSDLGERQLLPCVGPRDQLGDVLLGIAEVHGTSAAPAREVVLLAHVEPLLPRLEIRDVKCEVVRARVAGDERRRRADVLRVPRRERVGIGCGEASIDDAHRARC